MTVPVSAIRQELATIVRAAIDAVDAGRLVQRACDQPDMVAALQLAADVHVIAAGKASAAMLNAFAASSGIPFRQIMGVAPSRPDVMPEGTEWFVGGHPLPNDGSVAAARRALAVAQGAAAGDLVVVLLSGGGSALMALPADTVSLTDKQATAHQLMANGADIFELNTVRKHLSAIKGGQLAAATPARVITLAVSDVVGDDLSVIASGPTVADDTTFADALDVIARRGGEREYPPSVIARLQAGRDGHIPETPAAGDARLERARASVIGPQRGAIEGARLAAESLGYTVLVIERPVTGEAREAAPAYAADLAPQLATLPRPLCVISAGETTVTVRGAGKGGRNQEFALALVPALSAMTSTFAAASIGTDGIDGPTDAAGAAVDHTTAARAAALNLDAQRFLDDNDTYAFFDRLGDLIRTGPTSTNVGDLQVMLIV